MSKGATEQRPTSIENLDGNGLATGNGFTNGLHFAVREFIGDAGLDLVAFTLVAVLVEAFAKLNILDDGFARQKNGI